MSPFQGFDSILLHFPPLTCPSKPKSGSLGTPVAVGSIIPPCGLPSRDRYDLLQSLRNFPDSGAPGKKMEILLSLPEVVDRCSPSLPEVNRIAANGERE